MSIAITLCPGPETDRLVLSSRTSQVNAEKLLTLLNEELDVKDSPSAVPLVVSDGVIEFGLSLILLPNQKRQLTPFFAFR